MTGRDEDMGDFWADDEPSAPVDPAPVDPASVAAAADDPWPDDPWPEGEGAEGEWVEGEWVEQPEGDEGAEGAEGAGGGGTGRAGDAAASGGGGRSQRDRSARIAVMVVLLAALVGGVALGRQSPDVTTVRVATAGLDGPEVPPADAVSTAWYCAAGTSVADGSADETVYVANLSPTRITAQVTVDPGGDEDAESTRLRIEPYERASLAISEVLAVEHPGVVVEVAGGAAIVEHEIRAAGDVAMSACSHAPASTWYFANGGTPRGATQTLELFNPFGDDAIVDIALLTDGGVQEPQELQGLVVGRRSKVSVPVTDLVTRQENIATVVRTRTGRVVAEQVRSFDGSEGLEGLALSLGAVSPRRQWTLPVAAAQTGVTGAVAIANFGPTPASVEVSILLSGEGVLVPETVDVPSRSVVRFDPSERIPVGTAYSLVVLAQGSRRVVAEAVVSAPSGAASALGSSIAARRWALAGAPRDASSAVVVVNRANRPVTVELRAYTAGDVDGPPSAPAVALAPGKSARFDLDEWGIGADQVLVVSANGPVVAGRETYAGGVSLSLGVPFPG